MSIIVDGINHYVCKGNYVIVADTIGESHTVEDIFDHQSISLSTYFVGDRRGFDHKARVLSFEVTGPAIDDPTSITLETSLSYDEQTDRTTITAYSTKSFATSVTCSCQIVTYSKPANYDVLIKNNVAINGTFDCPSLFPKMVTVDTPAFSSDGNYIRKYDIGDPLIPMIVIKNLLFTGYILGEGTLTASTKLTDIIVIAGIQKQIPVYSDQNQVAYTFIYLSYDDGVLEITASYQYFQSIKSVYCDAISYIKLV